MGMVARALPPVGAPCKVQFRRDLLGTSRDLPVPPMTDSMNGAETSLSGRFLRMDDEWIVLERNDNEQVWVPREVVLAAPGHDPLTWTGPSPGTTSLPSRPVGSGSVIC